MAVVLQLPLRIVTLATCDRCGARGHPRIFDRRPDGGLVCRNKLSCIRRLRMAPA
jgi:hypothetical protein